jgi:hypothetical protein
MSLLPRRGTGRHGQHGGVAVHPGWTLSPTSVTDGAVSAPTAPADEAAGAHPTSRWTSTPAAPADAFPVPAQLPAQLPVQQPAPLPVPAPVPAVAAVPVVSAAPAVVASPPAVAAVVATVVSAPTATADPGWASEWEAVASTPATPSGAAALHTAAVAALDAVFGSVTAPVAWATAPAAWTAAPADLEPQLPPVPLLAPALTALDLPMAEVHSGWDTPAATPLAVAAAFAVPVLAVSPQAVSLQAVSPQAVSPQAVSQLIPPPPASPPPPPSPRAVPVPAPVQQLVERAIRSAPPVSAHRRTTVRLGFADASVVDLRPDDPIAKALHTVAAALIGRE